MNAQLIMQGVVKTQGGNTIENCAITIGIYNTISDKNGKFTIKIESIGDHILKVRHIAYQPFELKIKVEKNLFIEIELKEKSALLNEVLVQDSNIKIDKNTVNQLFIQKNNQGSLMKSLENLPGINAVGIGVQASKPIVRGMGFTRVAVVENGFKHEGQQWGADHGLEIESSQVESVEILKGVDAMLYGSDAVAGVIKINNNKKPLEKGIIGNFNTLYNSINQGVNSTINVNFTNENWFYKVKGSFTDFADYKIPTDNILYLTQIIPVENKILKNTAGQEKNILTQVGFMKNNFSSTWTTSYYDFKMGFFPGAHGNPSPNRVRVDGNSRNIDFPRQEVTHFKILGHNQYQWKNNSVEILTGFQQNIRQELSYFHSHYPLQPIPIENPEQELYFNLKTIDVQGVYKKIFPKDLFTLSLEMQNQDNSINGYQFLLPSYQRQILSATVAYHLNWKERWKTKFGLRLDQGNYSIERFFDSNFYNYLIGNGNSSSIALDLATRSKGLDKKFNAFNYGITTIFQKNEKSKFTYHLGSVFRFPTVMELASNGVHHGSFRHEKGDVNLNIEKGFNTELSYYFKNENHELNANLYFFYFDNYLYLKPSGIFSLLPHAGQTYKYTQSIATMGGLEIQWKKSWNKWQSNLVVELLGNQEVNSGFGLPFSPASNGFLELFYTVKENKYFKNNTLRASVKHSLEQKNIAQNEDFTPHWTVFNFGFSTDINIFKSIINTRLNVYNLLDDKYFNHTSFYKPIGIPEQGRNIQLSLGARF